jgi:uncharacterized protein (DUF58 family)
VREGEATVARTVVHGAQGVEHVAIALARHPWTAFRPAAGVRAALVPPSRAEVALDVAVGSLRWGRRTVGNGVAAVTGPWAGYRCGPVSFGASPLTTLPSPGPFDATAPAPQPFGVVGTHPARRSGDGSEFAGIRPFALGDRLRRVHWRVSLRTGTLHVRSTLSEEDTSVLLLVDSGVEVGASGGVRGAASSLDVAVRAAGAVAEHYLHQGDRVGLRVLGSGRHDAVPVGSGRRHLRRVLDTLTRVVPGDRREVDPARMRLRVPAGGVVLVFSTMLWDGVATLTTTLARQGLSVVVVDCLPERVEFEHEDPPLRLAWRLRRLERDQMLGRLVHAGIPVVAWRGPGTLDEVLRRLARRAARPRPARR